VYEASKLDINKARVAGETCGLYGRFNTDAMLALLFAMDALARKGVSADEIRGDALKEELYNMNFAGVTGQVTVDENGDRAADYEIFNYRGCSDGRDECDDLIGADAAIIGRWVGATAETLLDMDIIYEDGTTNPVPEGFPLCLPGTTGPKLGECTECPAGSKGAGGRNACELCPAGRFSSAAGSSECDPCLPGQYSSEAGSTSCQACAAGFFTDVVGQTTCEPCAAGQTSEAGSATCDDCPIGTYRGEDDGAKCKQCAGEGETRFTTLTRGASSASMCTCPPKRFWNRRDDRCDECPAEAFCPGGLYLPVAFEGNYGLYLGDVDNYAEEEAAKLSGTFVKSSALFHKMEVYKCGDKTSRCPGSTMKWAMDAYNVDGVEKKHVVIGAPLAGSCPQNSDPSTDRTGIACDRCQDGYYGTGKACLECNGGVQGGSVVLILLVPVIMVCIYRGTTSSGTQRVQAAFILVSTCGMGAFFMQTIGVFSTFQLTWPEELAWLFEISAIFMFDLNSLGASCFHGSGFAGKYWATIMVPLFVIACTGVGYLATQVLPVPEAWKMLPNQTMSMLGMLLTALYITLVKVVVAFWECVDNPSAGRTLAKYKDVVCSSDEHNEVLPAMALGLILYVIGGYFGFLHAAYVAPSKWMDVTFRERWKFMLTRWRPDTYYWGSVVMTRNLLVAFAGLVSDAPRVQLVYVVCVVVIVFAMTGAYMPWRAMVLNHYDVASSIVLTFIGVFGIIFVSLDKEIDVQQQNDLPTQDKLDEQRTFGAVLSALVAIFLALFGALCVWCVSMVFPGQVEKQTEAHNKECRELTAQLHQKVSSANFKEESARLIQESTTYDRLGLKNFLIKIDADQATHKSGATDTISIQKAKDNSSSPAQTVSA